MLTRAVGGGEAEKPLSEMAVKAGGYRVYPDQPLSLALEKLGSGAMLLPVVGRLRPNTPDGRRRCGRCVTRLRAHESRR